jgi:hypothetical protein
MLIRCVLPEKYDLNHKQQAGSNFAGPLSNAFEKYVCKESTRQLSSTAFRIKEEFLIKFETADPDGNTAGKKETLTELSIQSGY